MVTETRVKLTREEYYSLFNTISEKGYYVHEHFSLPRTVQTDIPCPICNEKLMYIQSGASYSIKCPTANCVDVGVRGI